WSRRIDLDAKAPPQPRGYYTAQGNATRIFFRGKTREAIAGWRKIHAEAFAAFSYVLSGGYSKPALYPAKLLSGMKLFDRSLSRWPRLFGTRCLVVLARTPLESSL